MCRTPPLTATFCGRLVKQDNSFELWSPLRTRHLEPSTAEPLKSSDHANRQSVGADGAVVLGAGAVVLGAVGTPAGSTAPSPRRGRRTTRSLSTTHALAAGRSQAIAATLRWSE